LLLKEKIDSLKYAREGAGGLLKSPQIKIVLLRECPKIVAARDNR
jgi:hypothetical protein